MRRQLTLDLFKISLPLTVQQPPSSTTKEEQKKSKITKRTLLCCPDNRNSHCSATDSCRAKFSFLLLKSYLYLRRANSPLLSPFLLTAPTSSAARTSVNTVRLSFHLIKQQKVPETLLRIAVTLNDDDIRGGNGKWYNLSSEIQLEENNEGVNLSLVARHWPNTQPDPVGNLCLSK